MNQTVWQVWFRECMTILIVSMWHCFFDLVCDWTLIFVSSSLFDFGERSDYLFSSQQNNSLSYQVQTSYPASQPQYKPQTSLGHMSYLTPNPPDSSPTSSYMTFGPGANSSGVVTYSTGGHNYFQSQSTGQIMMHSTGHHGESQWSDFYM